MELKKVIIIFCLATCTSYAQNLIPNPSFEYIENTEQPLHKPLRIRFEEDNVKGRLYVEDWRQLSSHQKRGRARIKTSHYKKHVLDRVGVFPPQHGYIEATLHNNFSLYTALIKNLRKGRIYKLTYHLTRHRQANPSLNTFYMDVILAKSQLEFAAESSQIEVIEIPYSNIPLKDAYGLSFNGDSIIIVEPEPKFWKKFATNFVAKDEFGYIGFVRRMEDRRDIPEDIHIDNIQLHCLDCPPEENESLARLSEQVQFETGKAVLTSDTKSSIELAIPDLQKFMDETSFLLVEGHTDNVGSRKDNLELSQARADAIKAFLVEKGIPATQIITKGYGDKEPIADNATKEGRAQNRRVELELLYPETAPSVIFEPLTWEQSLEKSKRTGKPIFLDAVTSWCKPCKKMDRDVFTDSAVAAFFNANFINLKFDMEAEESKAVKEKYKVGVYPTLLFVDGGGEVIYGETGYANPDELLTVSEAVKSSGLKSAEEREMKIYQSLRRSYFDNPCDTEKAHAFFKQLDGEEDPAKLQDFERLKDVYLECMKTQQTYSRKEAEFVLGILSRTPRDPVYRFFQEHRDKFEANYGDSLLAYEGYTEEVFFFNRIDSLRSHEEVNYKQLEQICADYLGFSQRLEEESKAKDYSRPISDAFVRLVTAGASMKYARANADNAKAFDYFFMYFPVERIPVFYQDSWYQGNTALVSLYLKNAELYLKDEKMYRSEVTKQFLGAFSKLRELYIVLPPELSHAVTGVVEKLEKL